MTKILIILLLLLFLLAMIATRYRRQIMMGIQVFQMFRKMRAANRTPATEKQIPKKDSGAAVPLVKCVKCGTWVPRSNAMKLGGNTYYCSTVCVEKSEVRV